MDKAEKKFNCIDLLCGCGGLSEGFKLAGFNIIGGVDFNQRAIDTYNHNFKGAKGICCALLKMDKDKIIEEFGDLKISGHQRTWKNFFERAK